MLEQRRSGAKEDRVHEHAMLIDHIHQGGDQIGTPKDRHVFSRLAFELLNFLFRILFDQPRIFPIRALQGSGKDDLRQAVHEAGNGRVIPNRGGCGPITCHELIRHAPKKKHANRACLFDSEFIEFFIHVMPVNILVGALEETVQADHVEREKF